MSAQTTPNFIQDTEINNTTGSQTPPTTALKHSHRTL